MTFLLTHALTCLIHYPVLTQTYSLWLEVRTGSRYSQAKSLEREELLPVLPQAFTGPV
ncbi:hypothetical protein MPNT_70077 [Candidatus Methylacidithermus pantelleriae]|uniref:Uncharacterized protein n=1 Tax=Candidatus Methylacidithermus pantelleriae TaxID=2744239 RepID=A0A8J2BSN8_9BACT|nr:hypothetical protein MPNT_70077 [Candidatus Methylacidithermus pantelleriae]